MNPEETKKPKALNITLWVLQTIYAAFYLMVGIMKFAKSVEEQRQQVEWPNHVSENLIHFVGVMEILGAIGLLLPSILKIKPGLTPLAALGLATIMILAAGLNAYIGQFGAVVFTLILATIALFIAWGRYKKVPIRSE